MRIFFAEPSDISEDKAVIKGSDAHHIKNVLRLEKEDDIILCDGSGFLFYCKIDSFSDKEVQLHIIKKELSKDEPKINVTVYQGVAKGDKLETVIQKCTELGAQRIVPVAMKRSVAIIKDKEKKKIRMQRIAYEASKQCRRSKVPVVSEVMDFDSALKDAKDIGLKLIAYEDEDKRNLKSFLSKNEKDICIFIGPEGGFDPSEIEKGKRSGFETVSLGPRILRTETAALAFLSAVMYETEDM